MTTTRHAIWFRGLGWVFPLLFLGCATVKEARRLQDPANQVPGERTVAPSEMGLFPGKTVALSDLEQIARVCNPSVLQARKAVESAELSLKDVKADYLPSVSGTLGYEQATDNESRHNQHATTHGTYSAEITLDLLLYDFGKTDSKVKQAVSQLVSSEKDFEQTCNEVVYNVRTAFFQVKQSIELHRVAVESVAQYKAHLDQMRYRLDVGKGTPYECTKAEVDWDNALLDQLTTSNDIDTAWAELNLSLGFAQRTGIVLGDYVLTNYNETVDGLMAVAREREPGLASLRLQAEAASNYVNQTVADLYPTLSLNFDALTSARSLDFPVLWNASGAGSLAQTLFDGKKNLNAIRSAVVQLQTARSAVSAYEQTLYRNLRESVSSAASAKQQYQVALASEKMAEQNLANVTAQFNVGKSSSVDRTDAQVSFSEAQAKVITTRYDFLTTQAKLAYLIGG